MLILNTLQVKSLDIDGVQVHHFGDERWAEVSENASKTLW